MNECIKRLIFFFTSLVLIFDYISVVLQKKNLFFLRIVNQHQVNRSFLFRFIFFFSVVYIILFLCQILVFTNINWANVFIEQMISNVNSLFLWQKLIVEAIKFQLQLETENKTFKNIKINRFASIFHALALIFTDNFTVCWIVCILFDWIFIWFINKILNLRRNDKFFIGSRGRYLQSVFKSAFRTRFKCTAYKSYTFYIINLSSFKCIFPLAKTFQISYSIDLYSFVFYWKSHTWFA